MIIHIPNKSFCLQSICMCTVYIYYVCIYKDTHLQHISWKYFHAYIYIHIIDIIYKITNI